MVWKPRRIAISERKTVPVKVRTVKANFWRLLLDREAGLRPAKGRRLRRAIVVRPKAKKLGNVREA